MARTRKDTKAKHRVAETLDALRLLRGLDRAAHFAAGGTPADWRGVHDVRPDRRKAAARRACRRRVTDE